jgi:prepilin-type N-terminal cleavage/methylation domain-containing protein/prepilin-type processing-associated H-X9-DG protein
MNRARRYLVAGKAKGFTLVELLVVISVIAMLASLLLPALSSAKAKAHGVGCLSNLKQMTLAWTMYVHDHQDNLVLNMGDQATADWESWVRGTLTLDAADPIQSMYPAEDSTNILYLLRSPLAPYGARPGIWRCPSDKSTRTLGSQSHPRVRSLAMNVMLGASRCPNIPPVFGPWRNRNLQLTSQIRNPGPAQCFVFHDEREDSIYESKFEVSPAGLRPPPGNPEPANPAQYSLMHYPGSYHSGAGNFSYADGHAEGHKWLDARTRPPLVKDRRLLTEDPVNGFPSPGNPDVHWLQERTFQRAD